MLRTHAPETATQTEDAMTAPQTEPPGMAGTALPWQTLQGSIGNAAVARLLGSQPAAPAAGYVMRLPEDEAVLDEQAPQTDAGETTDLDNRAEAEPMSGKRSKAQAITMVPTHVEPKDCFVWYEGNKTGWAPIPGTGCAHWVAHQNGYKTGAVKCDLGFTCRVADITKSRSKVEMKDVKVGDLWENPTEASHIGIVRAVNQADGKVTGVDVEHDSVRSGGVVTSTFTEGLFYR